MITHYGELLRKVEFETYDPKRPSTLLNLMVDALYSEKGPSQEAVKLKKDFDRSILIP